ncbi:MAG: TIM barrel protein [Actinomycetota bacterium]|nr:TIM barrel protein [Actinomycetota bacterium]
MTTLRVAGAPISWGVCEVPGWGFVVEPGRVLDEMAELGLTATELGPPGYLPAAAEPLRELLKDRGLDLVGGFLAAVLHDQAVADRVVDEAAEVAALFAEAGGEVLVLAAATGLDGYDVRPVLTDTEWATLIDTAGRIRDAAAALGVDTVLHPHVGTHVERREEVERFLADSDLRLCLDTGHLLIGGTDPVDLVRRHAGRIGHVHLKDVRADLAAQVRAAERGYTDAVRDRMYVPLGDGDVDIATVVGLLIDAGYSGWFVLEQDAALTSDSPANQCRDDARRSLEYLGDIVAGSRRK